MLHTNVLFVDEANADRSIFAEAYFNQCQSSGIRAFSAGYEPVERLDRQVYDLLREEGISPDDYCPKPVDIFKQSYSPRIDLVVGFLPTSKSYSPPWLPDRPPMTKLAIEPVDPRAASMGRKRALRGCLDDIKLAIDRARASGQLPSAQAA